MTLEFKDLPLSMQERELGYAISILSKSDNPDDIIWFENGMIIKYDGDDFIFKNFEEAYYWIRDQIDSFNICYICGKQKTSSHTDEACISRN